MSIFEKYTLVDPVNNNHYDTNDQRFYDQKWEKTLDSKKYLQQIVKSNPEKFKGYVIQKTA